MLNREFRAWDIIAGFAIISFIACRIMGFCSIAPSCAALGCCPAQLPSPAPATGGRGEAGGKAPGRVAEDEEGAPQGLGSAAVLGAEEEEGGGEPAVLLPPPPNIQALGAPAEVLAEAAASIMGS
jgi:hypothetical protein